MNNGQKVLNVLGIICAWILSICLVVLLLVAPITLSTLSLSKPQNLCETVKDIDLSQIIEVIGLELPDAESQQLAALLRTDAVQELYETYIDSVFSSLGKDMPQVTLDEETVRQIVQEHIDELYQLALPQMPELDGLSVEEGKAFLEEYAISLFNAIELPSAESLEQELNNAMSAAQTVLDLWDMVDVAKGIFVGVVVVITLLIFVCRLPGWRGFRWLATNLFIGSGLNALICAVLGAFTSLIVALFGDLPAGGLIVGTLMPVFSRGVFIRTGIMLVSAIALLVAYIYIKKYIAKKAVSPAPSAPAEPWTIE